MTTPKRQPTDPVAAVLHGALVSPNETGSDTEPANVVDGLFAIARAIGQLASTMTKCAEKADSRAERITSAIRSISHGGVNGPTGLEMLSIAINGEGQPGRNPVSDAISGGLGEIAEAIREAASDD